MFAFARAVSHFAQKHASNFVQHSRLTSSRLCGTINSESEREVKQMTNKELRLAKQDFAKCMIDIIDKYKPNDSDMGILYTSFLQMLATTMSSWFWEEREETEC